MSKREYKLAAAFFFILGIGIISFAVDQFIDERALRKEHSVSEYGLVVGLMGVFAAAAIRVAASRQQTNGQK